MIKMKKEEIKNEKTEKEEKTEKIEKIVPDTSVLINGELSQMITSGKLKKSEIIIPKTVVDELQAQASRGRDIGFKGLEEIKKIRELCKDGKVSMRFAGQRPTFEEIQLAKKGRIDALIRDVAVREGAKLLTADYVQALVGEVEGVAVEHMPQKLKEKLTLEGFFDSNTQSVHMKVGVPVYAKKGKPGEVKVVRLAEKPCTEDEVKAVVEEVMSKTRRDPNSFIEISNQGAMVIQMREYRIAITRPPFSDALELTAVRPIAKISLDDYKLNEELKKKLVSGSEGVLIAGPPGSGKSTFAASIADFLSESGKIVKTFEQPRDLQVGPSVTQYAPLEGDWEKTADILLLVRPDYTIFDEIRKTRDFRVFADMRLAGVGMIGVVHSTDPVSAIQRFIGRIELGMIPHVIDTVIYINAGKIERVYELNLVVKIPSGMQEADLTRPVVELLDFETKRLEYEIYTYGEENVIVPVQEQASSPMQELAKKKVQEEMRKWDPEAEIEFLSGNRIKVKVNNDVIARLIGKQGQNIERVEKSLGIKITVEPKESTLKGDIPFGYEESGANILLKVDRGFIGEQVDVYLGKDYIFSAYVGKKGYIKVRKNTDIGRKTLAGIAGKNLKLAV